MSCNCDNKPIRELDGFLSGLEIEKKEKTEKEDYLIPILQKAQEIYGWLPDEVLTYIAEKTGIKPAKIMGVTTFYTMFRTKPVGKNLILLCQGTACHVNGSAEIEAAIRDELKVNEGETTPDGLFTYNNVACLGCCSLSPVMMVGNKTYGKLTKKSVVEAINIIRRENKTGGAK